MNVQEDLYKPWYRDPSSDPFQLKSQIKLDSFPSNRFRSVSIFPWSRHSPGFLPDRTGATIDPLAWDNILNEYSDAVAVGSDTDHLIVEKSQREDAVFVFFPRSKTRRSIRIELPFQKTDDKIVPYDKIHVAWVLNPDMGYQPFLVITNRYQVYIYSFEDDSFSVLRGHGNHITSIAVHPTIPNIFATTSRDHTTRIYDCTLSPKLKPNNPHWPPTTRPSLAGAAHGLDITGPEGKGKFGRCIMVLVGGPSGGHNGDVFAAAFNAKYPLIATGGMDRAVKIWHIPFSTQTDKLITEDKPLFSSTSIHKARVLSINWITDDLLLSHSAPAIGRIPKEGENLDASDLLPGQMMLWSWLGKDRFFPPKWDRYDDRQTVLRGCASDYQESSSFKIISSLDLPRPRANETQVDTTTSFRMFVHENHDPIVLYTCPQVSGITIHNIADFPPQKPPPCPWINVDQLAQAADQLHISIEEDDSSTVPQWKVGLADGRRFECCDMAPDGGMVVATQANEITVWHLDEAW